MCVCVCVCVCACVCVCVYVCVFVRACEYKQYTYFARIDQTRRNNCIRLYELWGKQTSYYLALNRNFQMRREVMCCLLPIIWRRIINNS